MSKRDDRYFCPELIDIGQQVREAMELRGIQSQAQFAKMIGVAPASLNQMLDGTRMSIRQLVRIADALDCEVEVTLKTRPKQRRDYAIEWEGAA